MTFDRYNHEKDLWIAKVSDPRKAEVSDPRKAEGSDPRKAEGSDPWQIGKAIFLYEPISF